jgi:hypothetical protein
MPRHPPIALKTLDRSHCQCPSVLAREPCSSHATDGIGTKRPASRDLSGGAVRLTHHLPGIERPKRRTMLISTRPLTEGYGPSWARLRTWNPNKSSLYDVIQNRHRAKARRKPFFFMDECFLSTPRIWWSRTGSNRRHPACKAGALPAELRPLITFVLKEVVGLGGLEPPTSRLSSARSNQLSYKPLAELSKSPQIRSEAPQARLRVAAYAAPSRSASTRRVRYGA